MAEQYFDAESASTRKCEHGKLPDDYCPECEGEPVVPAAAEQPDFCTCDYRPRRLCLQHPGEPAPPAPAAPVDADTLKWQIVHRLLEPWRVVWNGDKQIVAEYPQWAQDAAAELFAHDLCDEWKWDDHVNAAAKIIMRHFRPELVRAEGELKRLRERIEALQSLLPEGIQIASNAATSSRNGWTIGRSEGKRAEAFVEAARKLLARSSIGKCR